MFMRSLSSLAVYINHETAISRKLIQTTNLVRSVRQETVNLDTLEISNMRWWIVYVNESRRLLRTRRFYARHKTNIEALPTADKTRKTSLVNRKARSQTNCTNKVQFLLQYLRSELKVPFHSRQFLSRFAFTLRILSPNEAELPTDLTEKLH
jgi:hypothetical protein